MLTVDIERLPSYNRGFEKGIQKGIDKGKHEAMKISAKALKSLGQNEEQTSHPCRSISTFIHQKISEKHNRLHSFKPSPKIL